MSAGTIVQMRSSFIRTAVFLPGFAILRKLSIPVHGKARFTDRCAARQLYWILCISLNLPTYTSVGVYEYTLTPDTVNLAGVDYRTAAIKLVVTVINDGDGKIRVAAVHTEAAGGEKANGIAASYTANKLSVSKTVSGNLGDQTKYFEFKITLTGVTGKTYADTFTVDGGSYTGDPTSIRVGVETTFHLKHEDTINILNIPEDVTYTVTETSATGYETYVGAGLKNQNSTATGTTSDAAQTAAFTNIKNGTVDTGVMLDSLPYILVLAFVAVAGTALIMKKRANF